MEPSFDAFDFTQISDVMIPTAASQESRNQHSNHSIFRPGGAHWRCDYCMESVIYSRASGYGQYVRMWTCCQCGFDENRVSLWAACSMCDYTNVSEKYAFQNPSVFQHGTENPIEHEETFETSRVVCAGMPAAESSGTAFASPTDDIGSTVRQNLARSESSFPDGLLENEVVCSEFEGIGGLTSMNSMGYKSFAADTMNINAHRQPEVPESFNTAKLCAANLCSHAGDITTFPSEKSTSEEPTTTDDLTTSTLTVETLQNIDSGYGPSCNTSKTDTTSRKRVNEFDQKTTATITTSHSHSNPPPCKKPRRRRLNPLKPGLACPFYIRNPYRCKQDSCAGPGFLGINRLKQHFERVHLYHRCSRCGDTFFGNAVGRESLAAHQRGTQPCQLLADPNPDVWGISYSTFEAMRSKRGTAGKPEDDRWREIYQIIFPDAEEEEIARPYVDTERIGLSHYHQNSGSRQIQAVDNFSRKLLHILPARLDAAVRTRCDDSRLVMMWNGFVNAHLHDVLRDTFSDVTSAVHKQPLVESKIIEEGRCEELDDAFSLSMQEFVDIDGG